MPRPGSSQVSSAAASVEVEGSIVQQKPPEDHAGHEWKQLKDSDSAGQYSSANDEIGREVKQCMEVDIEVLKTKKLSQKKWSHFFTAESANA